MCASGRAPGSSRKFPAGTKTRSSDGSPGTTEPQRPQKARKKPGVDSQRTTDSCPRMRKPARGPPTYVANSEPCVLRQREQWQWCISSNGPSSSQVTAPQRQLAGFISPSRLQRPNAAYGYAPLVVKPTRGQQLNDRHREASLGPQAARPLTPQTCESGASRRRYATAALPRSLALFER